MYDRVNNSMLYFSLAFRCEGSTVPLTDDRDVNSNVTLPADQSILKESNEAVHNVLK
jgi:hypothetical protein